MLSVLQALESPVIESLGWALVHFVWQAALLAGLLAVMLVPLRRASARVRYLVQCAMLVAMAACPMVTWWWIASTMKSDEMTAVAPVESVVPAESMNSSDEPAFGPMVTSQFETEQPITVAPAPAMRDIARQPIPATMPPPEQAATWNEQVQQRITPALPWLVGAWLLGVVVLSLRLLVGWRIVQRLKRLAVTPVAEAWQLRLRQLAERLGVARTVKLVESALVEVPTVIGWLRPVILLPVSLLTSLPPQQLEAVLAHELAHIRRHDYLVNLIQTAIETLLFYHPAVWWMSRMIRDEREHCCDDLAVSLCDNPVAYVSALAAMEELRSSPTMTLAANGGSLLSRIRRIALASPSDSRRSTRWGASLIALTALAALGPTTYFAAYDRNEPSSQPVEAMANSSAETRAGEKEQPAVADSFTQVFEEFTADSLPVKMKDVSQINDPAQLLDQLEKGPRVSHFLMTGGGIFWQPATAPQAWQVELWNGRFAGDKQLDPRVRQLIKLGDVARSIVQERFAVATPQVQSHLAMVLRSTGTAESIPVLIQSLKDLGKSDQLAMDSQFAMTTIAVTSALWELTGRKHLFTPKKWDQWWNGVKGDFVVSRDRQRPEVSALVTSERVNALIAELAKQEEVARERLISLGPAAVPHLLESLQSELKREPVAAIAKPGEARPIAHRLAWVIDELGATDKLATSLRCDYFTQRFSDSGTFTGLYPIDEDALSRALSLCSFTDYCSIFLDADSQPVVVPHMTHLKWPHDLYAGYCRRFNKLSPPNLGGWTSNPHWSKVVPAEDPAGEIAGAVPILLAALKDERVERRASASKLAAAIGFCCTAKPEKLIIALRDAWLVEADDKVRPEIAFAMCRFQTPFVVKEITNGVLSDRPEIVSDCAGLMDWIPIQLNDETRAAFDRLVELTRHENDRVRRASTRSLASKSPQLLGPEFERLCTDKVKDIREACTLALRSNPDPKHADILFKLADDAEQTIRESAFSSIGNLRHPESMSRLIPHLRDPKVHGYAVSALASMGGKGALPLMMDELKAGNDVGGMVYQHLRRLSGETFEEKPEPWLAWWKQQKTVPNPNKDSAANSLRKSLEFLKPYPKLHGLSLDMTEPQFLEIVKQQELKTRKATDGDKVQHHIALGDGHTLIVMFDKDAKCSGIQRVRSELLPNAERGKLSFQELREFVTQLNGAVTTLDKNEEPSVRVELKSEKVDDAAIRKLAGYRNLRRVWTNGTVPITDEALAALAQCDSLKELHLQARSPAITDAGLKYLARLQSLESLRLSNITMTDAGMKHLASLPRLKELNVSSNQLGDEGIAILAPMEGLENLMYDTPNLSDDGLKAISKSKSLRYLQIHSKKVSDVGMTHLAQMTGITGLVIQDSEITDAGVMQLASLPQLIQLFVMSDQLGDEGIASLAPMEGLMHLMYEGAKLSDDGLKAISKSKSLQIFDFSSEKVTDIGLTHLAQMTDLESLGIENAEITDAGILVLKQPNLQSVSLDHCPKITADGVKAWKAVAPHIKIEFHDEAVAKLPAGLEFLKPYPKLHGLSLDMTEPQFLEITTKQELKTTKHGEGDKAAYHMGLGDGHTLIVMFDKDAKFSGIQRIRGDVDADALRTMAQQSFARGDYAGMERAYIALVTREVATAEDAMQLGHARHLQGRVTEAVESYLLMLMLADQRIVALQKQTGPVDERGRVAPQLDAESRSDSARTNGPVRDWKQERDRELARFAELWPQWVLLAGQVQLNELGDAAGAAKTLARGLRFVPEAESIETLLKDAQTAVATKPQAFDKQDRWRTWLYPMATQRSLALAYERLGDHEAAARCWCRFQMSSLAYQVGMTLTQAEVVTAAINKVPADKRQPFHEFVLKHPGRPKAAARAFDVPQRLKADPQNPFEVRSRLDGFQMLNTGPSQASVIKRKDGSWMMAFTGGDAFQARVMFARSADGKTWDAPFEFAHNDIFPTRSPVLIEDDNGSLWLACSSQRLDPNRYSSGGYQWWICSALSHDGQAWSPLKPLQHADGRAFGGQYQHTLQVTRDGLGKYWFFSNQFAGSTETLSDVPKMQPLKLGLDQDKHITSSFATFDAQGRCLLAITTHDVMSLTVSNDVEHWEPLQVLARPVKNQLLDRPRLLLDGDRFVVFYEAGWGQFMTGQVNHVAKPGKASIQLGEGGDTSMSLKLSKPVLLGVEVSGSLITRDGDDVLFVANQGSENSPPVLLSAARGRVYELSTRSQALPGNASPEAPPQVPSDAASPASDGAKIKTKQEAEPPQARPQAEPGNEKQPVPEAELLRKLVRGGKIDTKTINALITLVAARGAEDTEFARLVLAEFEKSCEGGDRTSQSRRHLLAVLTDIFEAWSSPRWRSQLSRFKPEDLPQREPPQADAKFEREMLARVIQHGYATDRSEIASFSLAVRQLHHPAGREFLRDVLRSPELQSDPFAPSNPPQTVPQLRPQTTPSPKSNSAVPAASRWKDNTGGGWTDAKFVAAVGLAELGEAEDIDWLLARAQPNEFGIDDSLGNFPHIKESRGSLRESSRFALADLFGLSAQVTVTELGDWWRNNRTKFTARPVTLKPRLGSGASNSALAPTTGLPESDKATKTRSDAREGQRPDNEAGWEDPGRAQNNAGRPPELRVMTKPTVLLPDHWIVQAVGFDGASYELVTASNQSFITIRRWDLASMKLLSEIKLQGDKHGRAALPITLKFSGDRRRVIAATDAYVGIWDAVTGRLLKQLPFEKKDGIYACAIDQLDCTPDLSVIVGHRAMPGRLTLSYDAHVIVWDGASGNVLRTVVDKGATDLKALDLSTDGKRLVTTNGSGAKIWDTSTGQMLLSIPNDNSGRKHSESEVATQYTSHVWSVQLSPDGKQLAMGDILGVKLIDVTSGRLLKQLEGPYRYSSSGSPGLVFSKDGERLARLGTQEKGDGDKHRYVVPIWSTRTGAREFELQTEANDAAFSDDGQCLAVVFSDMQQALSVWSLSGDSSTTDVGRALLPVAEPETGKSTRPTQETPAASVAGPGPHSRVDRVEENGHYVGVKAAEYIEQFKPTWNAAKLGLQYGIALTKPTATFKPGERVPLVVFIRNTSDKPIKFDTAPDFFGNAPKILNAKGEPIVLENIPLLGNIPHYHETLGPGEALGPFYLSVGLGQNPRPGQQHWHPQLTTPVAGQYKLTHSVLVNVPGADPNAPAKKAELTSSTVEFAIVDSNRREVSGGPPELRLADVVRDFNAENKQLGRGLDQPVVTEDEVITSIKRDEWKRGDPWSLNENEIAAFKAVAESKRLPKGSYLDVYTEERSETFLLKQLWQVRLMLPAIGHDGFVGLTIRNTLVAEEKIAPKDVAWGKPDADGLSLGAYLSPRKAQYALGERVRLRLFVRNDGKQAVKTTWANSSHPMPDDFTVTDDKGAKVAVRIGHDDWSLPWVSGYVGGGALDPGDVHALFVPYEISIGPEVTFENGIPVYRVPIGEGVAGGSSNKLIGRVIDAKPSQKLQLKVRSHNGSERERAAAESEPESGSIAFAVVEKPVAIREAKAGNEQPQNAGVQSVMPPLEFRFVAQRADSKLEPLAPADFEKRDYSGNSVIGRMIAKDKGFIWVGVAESKDGIAALPVERLRGGANSRGAAGGHSRARAGLEPQVVR